MYMTSKVIEDVHKQLRLKRSLQCVGVSHFTQLAYSCV